MSFSIGFCIILKTKPRIVTKAPKQIKAINKGLKRANACIKSVMLAILHRIRDKSKKNKSLILELFSLLFGYFLGTKSESDFLIASRVWKSL